MEYCVEYALANRKLMISRIMSILEETYKSIDFGQMINIAHNYARMENHFGQNVLVHRKGATSARKDEVGIIPGSQGTKSFIVKGLGNPESFNSCSHGSGRVMGRKESVRKLNLEEEIKKLDDQGIIHGMRNQKDLEEAVSSYKDINEVMANQSDLVEILVELSPVGSIKG
jgi:tRNA-splicing ligase RtcB